MVTGRNIEVTITSVSDNGQKNRRRERRHQERYAKRHGYYWMPCDLCGDEFGGHEQGKGIVPTTDPERFLSICPSCTAERQDKAEELLRKHEIGGIRHGTRWGFPEPVTHAVGAEYKISPPSD